MQHSKAYPFLIHAAALLAGLALCIAFIDSGTLTTHAQSGPPVNKSGKLTAPQGSPTISGNNSYTNPGSSGDCANQNGAIANPLRYCTLESLLGAVLDAAIKIGGIILTIALVWVGFLFVAARGNEEKISRAKAALMWTIIGGLILLGAKAIQSVITTTVTSLSSP